MNTTITKLRATMSDTIGRVRHTGERVIIEKNGKPAAAIVPIEDLEWMEAMERAEDEEDLRFLRECKEEGTVTLEEARKELGL